MSPRTIARAGVNGSAFLGSFALILVALSAVNLLADPYADFFYLTRWRMPRVRTLDDFTDLRFKTALLDRAGDHWLDAALFGSSRCMRLDPTEPHFASLAPRALNLAVQGARLGITRQFVERFARRNPGALALVGIDFFSFNETPLERSIFLDEQNPFPAWRECFWRLGSYRIVEESLSMRRGLAVSNELRASGLAVRAHPPVDEVRGILASFAEQGWKQWSHFRNFHYDRTKLDVLREIRTRFPRTVFFIPPVSRQFQQGQRNAGLDLQYRAWLDDLAALGGVIDFTDAAEIVDEPRYYLDMHHTDSAAGALMLADLAAFVRGEPLRYGRVLGAKEPAR